MATLRQRLHSLLGKQVTCAVLNATEGDCYQGTLTDINEQDGGLGPAQPWITILDDNSGRETLVNTAALESIGEMRVRI